MPSRSWFLRTWLRTLVHQFRAGLDARGRSAWQRWLIALTVGWIACGALMLGLVGGVRAWAEAGGQARDAGWLQALVQQAPVEVNQAIWMNLPGYAFFSIPILAVAAVWFVRAGRPLWALSMLASYFLVAVVIGLGWQLWDRPRPEIVLDGALVPGFHSFPSGHVAQAIPVYGLLVYAWVRQSRHWGERVLAWSGFAVLIGVVAVGRLRIGAHWPSDVAAGTLLGVVWLAVLVIALRRADAQNPPPQAVRDLDAAAEAHA